MISPYETVKLARSKSRPRAATYIEAIFKDIVYLRGDRAFGDSESIIGGIAFFDNIPVTFIGIQKGSQMEEAIKTDFGMPKPEGYRKALRLIKQAEKFNRPIITFIDTPGAYPGIDAEERGQFHAIAELLAESSSVTVPNIAFVIGEGGSGGALVLAVANKLYMLENSVFSILSPEGFASILWKDSTLADKAAELMKITAYDLKKYELIDNIIVEEPQEEIGGLNIMIERIREDLKELTALNKNQVVKQRYEKYRKIGI